MGGQPFAGLGGETDAGPARHIVEDHGDLYPVGNEGKVLIQALLRALVVIWCHHKDCVGTVYLCTLSAMQCCDGIVAANTDNDFHSPRVCTYCSMYEFLMLIAAERGVFTGCAAHHNSGRSVFILVIKVFLKSVIIDSMIIKRCYNCRAGALKNRCFQYNSLPIEDYSNHIMKQSAQIYSYSLKSGKRSVIIPTDSYKG